MKSNRRLSYLAGLAVGFTTIAMAARAQDCAPAHAFTTITPSKLTVAIYEAPPFTTARQDGSIGGTDGDILKKIAAKECLTIAPIVVDPAATIQYVLSGKADIAAGDWYRTAARAKVLGLSYPTYLDQMGIYSRTGISTVGSLIGQKVGAVSGYLWVAELQKLLGADLKLYPNPVALAQDLDGGRVDVAVDSYGTGVYAQKTGGYPGIQIKVAEPDERVQASVQPAQANLLFAKNNQGLGKALDADIEAMHKSGELADILKADGLDPSGANVGEPRLVK